jgi:hypothetical protein
VEQAAHRGDYSDKLFFITSVHLQFTSMNLTVLLLTWETLGLVDLWRISCDKEGTLKGMNIAAVNSVIVVSIFRFSVSHKRTITETTNLRVGVGAKEVRISSLATTMYRSTRCTFVSCLAMY